MGISSPLLRQAGFSKAKLTQAIQWVALPDGVSQVWVLTEDIPVFVGDIFKLKFLGGDTSGQTRYFIGDPNYQFGLFTSDNVFTGGNVDAEINSGLIVLSSTAVPQSGEHQLVVQATKAGVLRNIGGRDSSARINIPIYDFFMIRGGEVIHSIPLTNKVGGANQSALVGSVSAFMPNYTAAIWVNKADLL